MPRVTPREIAALACAMDVMCPKPGNVSPGRPTAYMNAMSFLASAMSLLSAFSGVKTVGRMVEDAALATRSRVERNTNLGMILLLAPLVKASPLGGGREAVRMILKNLDDDDARRVYNAIQVASPEGLGEVPEYDVRGDPPPLLTAMRAASGWDSVAREYADGYEITYETAFPCLTRLWESGRSLKDCILGAYLELLALIPDTQIARKLGWEEARRVSCAAADIVRAGFLTSAGRELTWTFADSLVRPDNALNPGTTADLTTAGLFVFLSSETERAGLARILARWEGEYRGESG